MNMGNKLTAYILVFLLIIIVSCNKKPSEHLKNALILMEGQTDYTNPVFDKVLEELCLVPENDPNFDHAQTLITRIENVRKNIIAMRTEDEIRKRKLEKEIAKRRHEYQQKMKELEANQDKSLDQDHAERELLRKLLELEMKEQQLIEEQERKRNKARGTPTPNPFKHTPTDHMGRSKEYWVRKHENLKRQLQTLENRLEYLRIQLNSLETAGLPKHVILKNRAKRIDILNKIEAVEKQIEKKKEEINNLPEDMRKAGALPGWIR